MKRFALPLAFLCACIAGLLPIPAYACETPLSVCTQGGDGHFLLAGDAATTRIRVDPGQPAPVQWAARMLADDIGRVTGTPGAVAGEGAVPGMGPVVIAGTLHSPAIAALVRAGKLDVARIEGRWEGYVQAVIASPAPGVETALVIAGSDPRGVVYGLLDISERIGVSPWYWWADVPVARREALWLVPGSRADAPAVKYRGFFINDEDPAFGGWAREKFGGVNSQVYGQVFELLLRLKGNYLWPAMWGKSLAEDDPASLALAAGMGVVLGTSHHEPLTRAHVEWERALADGSVAGDWNYETNGAQLREFWREGMERFLASGADGVVTIAMRGDGDEAMSEETAIPLLERIVADQRAIMEDVTGRPAAETPQVWALYKEVQDYYDQGMQVPGDVTLLFADDNWGQIRRLPDPAAAPRAGGYGVYYHFDYVGGPRSYKWIDTIQQGKTWQQMDLAWQRGARTLWVVNVGDIKPHEYPLDFFLDMAWDPAAMTPEALGDHSREWAARQFGAEHAEEIAALLDEYARLASRRKPELLDAQAMALPELAALSSQWEALQARLVDFLRRANLAEEMRPAFYQLVEHRIGAMANLYGLHFDAARNQRLAAEGDAAANLHGDRAQRAIARDAELTERYHALLGGKWNQMMSQPHIGYTSWDDPDANIYPELAFLEPDEAEPMSEIVLRHELPREVLGATQTSSRGSGAGLQFTDIPELGSRGEALVALPQGQPPTSIADGVFAQYTLQSGFERPMPFRLEVALVPTLDTLGNEGIRFGLQWDDGLVEEVNFYLEATNGARGNEAQIAWNEAVIGNIVRITRDFPALAPGDHTLRIYRIDDNLVLDHVALGVIPPGE